MIHRGEARLGFTLIEVLSIMMGLSLVLMISGVMLAGILRIQKASQVSLERTSARSALADQFRADVAGSRALLANLGGVRANESCLILGGNGGFIVYRFREKRVEREERSVDGTVLRQATIGPPVDRVRFAAGDHDEQLIAMTLEQSADKPQERRTWTFQAALRGDRQ